MQVKVSQAVRMITTAIKAQVVPMMMGSPGIGKSQIIYQIAEAYNLKVIDIRLSQCDPTDLSGFPTITGVKADYAPMAHFPIEGDPLPMRPEGGTYSGWLLFLDESTSAPPAIQAAAYKLVLDRMVGSHHLHKNVAMVMAGNMESDGAIVFPMSTALQSRLLHMELVVDSKEWLDWAESNGVYYRVISYIRYLPGKLYTFKADHTDHTYGCPRTWEFASRILKVEEHDSQDLLPLLAGTLSEGLAREFLTFCKIYDRLLKPAEIEANPETVDVPVEPSIRYALTGTLSHNMTVANVVPFMKFLVRLPKEFQIVAMREVTRKNRGQPLLKQVPIARWVAENAEALF